MHGQAEIVPPRQTGGAPATVGGRITRHALAGPRTARDDAGELVAQNERSGQPGVTDARLLVPVQIRSTQPHGGHAEQDLARTGTLRRFGGQTDVAPTVDPGR